MDLLKNVHMDNLADTQFRITWPCSQQGGERGGEERAPGGEDVAPGGKEHKKKQKKKKARAPPPPCATCRLGPAGAARGHVRRAALWCCTRCCLVCCSALRVLIAVVGVVVICLVAFYVLNPKEGKGEGGRVVRAGLRALGARLRRPHTPPPAPSTGLDPLQTVTTECDPGCLRSPRTDPLAGVDIEVVPGPLQVVDSSVIVSPHDSEAPDEQGENEEGASSPLNDAED